VYQILALLRAISRGFSLPKSLIIKDLQFIKIPRNSLKPGKTTRIFIKNLSNSLFSQGFQRAEKCYFCYNLLQINKLHKRSERNRLAFKHLHQQSIQKIKQQFAIAYKLITYDAVWNKNYAGSD
jgi:hypothetical protein